MFRVLEMTCHNDSDLSSILWFAEDVSYFIFLN